MPETAWLLVEDQALKTYLGDITVDDPQTTDRSVKVWFRGAKPEERSKSYPYIMLGLVDLEVDHEREHQGEVDWSRRAYRPYGLPASGDPGEAGVSVVTEYPTPYLLHYNVIACSRNPRHEAQLLASLTGVKFRRGAGMACGDEDTGNLTKRRVDLLNHFDATTTEDDGKRLFRHVYTVGVSSELLPGTVAAVQRALTIHTTFDARMEFDVALTP